MEIPTGHGKILIIAAFAIAKDPKLNCDCGNDESIFFSKCIHIFEVMRGVDNFPCEIFQIKLFI